MIRHIQYKQARHIPAEQGEGGWSGFLTQDEQQFLRSAQGEHGDETAALSVDYVMNCIAEAGLPLLPLLVNVCSIRGLLGEAQTSHYQIRKNTVKCAGGDARRH